MGQKFVCCKASLFGYFREIRDILQHCYQIDEEKLRWSFRLYDMDNNGVIDMEEMIVIIETLDSIEGVKPGETKNWEKIFEGVIRYDENGNPQTIASTRQRAEEIFKVRRKLTFTPISKPKIFFLQKVSHS